MSSSDLAWMNLALAEAERGQGSRRAQSHGRRGRRSARAASSVVGHHARFGGPHAEVMALRNAAESAQGATLYVTLEPCCHHGKTPPCTEAILQAGVAKVVAAIRDPFPRVDGGGLAILRSAGVPSNSGSRPARRPSSMRLT